MDAITTAKNEMNSDYDKETHHHINRNQQARWDSKLNELLNEVSGDQIQNLKKELVITREINLQ